MLIVEYCYCIQCVLIITLAAIVAWAILDLWVSGCIPENPLGLEGTSCSLILSNDSLLCCRVVANEGSQVLVLDQSCGSIIEVMRKLTKQCTLGLDIIQQFRSLFHCGTMEAVWGSMKRLNSNSMVPNLLVLSTQIDPSPKHEYFITMSLAKSAQLSKSLAWEIWKRNSTTEWILKILCLMSYANELLKPRKKQLSK